MKLGWLLGFIYVVRKREIFGDYFFFIRVFVTEIVVDDLFF